MNETCDEHTAGPASHIVHEINDVFDYLSLVFPNAKTTEKQILKLALAMCSTSQFVRVSWCPIADLDDPSQPMRHTIQLPNTYGSADGLHYFHGTDAYALPSIRVHGLQASLQGAGSNDPVLYTCKSRFRPLETYATT